MTRGLQRFDRARGWNHPPMILGVLLAQLACAQTPWLGHTTDRSKRIEIVATRHAQRIKVQPRSGSGHWYSPEYWAVAHDARALSPTGSHYAFAAKHRSGQWLVVRDGVEEDVWDGVAELTFSGVGGHLAYLVEKDARWAVVRDRKVGPFFRGVQAGTLRLSHNGQRLAYGAIEDGCVRVVVDEKRDPTCFRDLRAILLPEGEAPAVAVGELSSGLVVRTGEVEVATFDQVSEVASSPDVTHWGVVGKIGAEAALVVDGQIVTRAPRIEHLRFADRGSRYAYAVAEGGSWRMVLGGEPGPPADALTPVVFSSDGVHAAYLFEKAGTSHLFRDGRIERARPGAVAPVLSADGARVAYVAVADGRQAVVVDGEVFPMDVVVEGSVVFDTTGKHWGALVGSLSRRALWISLDGALTLPFDAEEFFGMGTPHAPLPDLLGRWIRAELEREVAR